MDKPQCDRLVREFKSNTRSGKPHPLYALVVLAIRTGMRRNELLALTFLHVDFIRKNVAVERALKGSGKAPAIGDPKSEAGIRDIALDEETVEALKLQRRRLGGLKYPDSSLVFPRNAAEPHVPMNPSSVSHRFGKRARIIGFRGLRLHDLRHVHATRLLASGTPVEAVSERLGHARTSMTVDVYQHVTNGAREKLMLALKEL